MYNKLLLCMPKHYCEYTTQMVEEEAQRAENINNVSHVTSSAKSEQHCCNCLLPCKTAVTFQDRKHTEVTVTLWARLHYLLDATSVL